MSILSTATFQKFRNFTTFFRFRRNEMFPTVDERRQLHTRTKGMRLDWNNLSCSVVQGGREKNDQERNTPRNEKTLSASKMSRNMLVVPKYIHDKDFTDEE